MQHLLMNIDGAMVDWARAQFALTAIYHWLFVPLTLGLALIMGIMETIYANISDAAKRYNATVGGNDDYVAGANIAGFERVAEAMMAQGLV